MARSSPQHQPSPLPQKQVLARHGYGVALLPKGEVYAGHFAGGARDGVGIVVHVDGSTYYGAWKAREIEISRSEIAISPHEIDRREICRRGLSAWSPSA